MVPDVAKTGHSFKGAMAYYLHDKGAATAERVAWAETRNLATDDPQAAQRIMIATAQRADELKAAAGIKNTGRKSKAHVYAYSLAWHPDEAGQLDRTEMLRAVDSSMVALGAEKHQAVIVCHQDQKHPHVHVIVNRVHPETGVMLSTSNDRLKLGDWANAYERERGVILTPKREEKRQLREQFADKAQRQDYAQQQRQKAAQRPDDTKSRAAMLKEFQEQQKAQHRQQWKDLAQDNKTARAAIYDGTVAAIKKAAARHKAECKPIWAGYFKGVRAEQQAFNQREGEIVGVIKNAMDATTHQKLTNQLGNRGTLSATFSNVLSSQARAQAFAERQDMNRQQMAARLKLILDAEIRQLKDERGQKLVAQRQSFDAARAVLIQTQDEQRAKIRQAWQHIYDERARSSGGDRQQQPARDRYQQRMAVRNQIRNPSNPAREAWQDRRAANAAMTAKVRQDAAPVSEQKPMKREFDNARRIDKPQPVAQTTPKFVSKPAPAPSPSGDVPKPAAREVREVPAQKPAPALKRLAEAKREFSPAAAKPAAPIRQQWQENKTDIQKPTLKRLPPRQPDRDREPER